MIPIGIFFTVITLGVSYSKKHSQLGAGTLKRFHIFFSLLDLGAMRSTLRLRKSGKRSRHNEYYMQYSYFTFSVSSCF